MIKLLFFGYVLPISFVETMCNGMNKNFSLSGKAELNGLPWNFKKDGDNDGDKL